MSTKGKRWKWAADAPGRKVLGEAMTQRLKDGQAGRAFEETHGLSQTPEYNHWKKMMSRCYNANNPDYVWYGGRGIKVCDQWHDVRQFVEDMGPKPVVGNRRMSIERVEVNGDYEPDNCIWLPLSMQSKNRREWKHTARGLENIRQARRAKVKDAPTCET